MQLRQREDHVYRRAYELAASGLHINPITIVSALIKEGYPEAAALLNSDIVRADLRQVCTLNWQGAFADESDSEAAAPEAANRALHSGQALRRSS